MIQCQLVKPIRLVNVIVLEAQLSAQMTNRIFGLAQRNLAAIALPADIVHRVGDAVVADKRANHHAAATGISAPRLLDDDLVLLAHGAAIGTDQRAGGVILLQV